MIYGLAHVAFVAEIVSIECEGITGQQLFEFMRSHDKKYGLSTLYMASGPFIDAAFVIIITLLFVLKSVSETRKGCKNFSVVVEGWF